MSKHKRITIDDRMDIQAGINENKSLKVIANKTHKSPSSIIPEIINNSEVIEERKTCGHCALVCLVREGNYVIGSSQKFQQVQCKRRDEFPYVCNWCEKKQSYKSLKRYYNFKTADEKSKKLIEPRKGR